MKSEAFVTFIMPGWRRGLVVSTVDYGVEDPRFESRQSQENFSSRKIIIINFFIFSEKISQWINNSSFNFHVRTNHDAKECRHALVGEV